MEELLELRTALEERRYGDALQIINEMEEMAQKDTVNKIGSFVTVLLVHLIKQSAENRTTRSWQRSIRNAAFGAMDANQRYKAKGTYLSENEIREIIEQRFVRALRDAADEAFEARYTAKQLAAKIDAEAIKAQALDYIVNGIPESEE